MEEIDRLADRITVLRDGQHICTAPVAQLSRDQLVSAMLGREWSGTSLRHPCPLGATRIMVSDFSLPDPVRTGRWLLENICFEVRAGESGIPVIVLDRQILGDSCTTFISADNEKIGEAAGRWVVENFPCGTKIVELKGLMTSTPGQQRHSGFRRAIEGAGFEILFEADMKWLEPNARQEMASALARFPRIDLAYALNDPGAHGAWLAARAVGRKRKLPSSELTRFRKRDKFTWKREFWPLPLNTRPAARKPSRLCSEHCAVNRFPNRWFCLRGHLSAKKSDCTKPRPT